MLRLYPTRYGREEALNGEMATVDFSDSEMYEIVPYLVQRSD